MRIEVAADSEERFAGMMEPHGCEMTIRASQGGGG
jgi:hypothetical protein